MAAVVAARLPIELAQFMAHNLTLRNAFKVIDAHIDGYLALA
jgi:hypothetical protein